MLDWQLRILDKIGTSRYYLICFGLGVPLIIIFGLYLALYYPFYAIYNDLRVLYDTIQKKYR